MPEPHAEELLGRIKVLERERDRWKWFALSLLTGLIVLLAGGMVFEFYVRILQAGPADARQP